MVICDGRPRKLRQTDRQTPPSEGAINAEAGLCRPEGSYRAAGRGRTIASFDPAPLLHLGPRCLPCGHIPTSLGLQVIDPGRPALGSVPRQKGCAPDLPEVHGPQACSPALSSGWRPLSSPTPPPAPWQFASRASSAALVCSPPHSIQDALRVQTNSVSLQSCCLIDCLSLLPSCRLRLIIYFFLEIYSVNPPSTIWIKKYF